VGVPAVLVPLPHGNGEQALNAAGLVEAQAAVLVADRDFTPDWVGRELIPLLQDTRRQAQMATAARALGIRDADERMAAMVFSAAGYSRAGKDTNEIR
jgi:UDP-N-acetylglucosamine--N-acetylmuramyl-(pentapeptide) pyrophosphoryl-undecaprenol N-acetylglucosamine transferase